MVDKIMWEFTLEATIRAVPTNEPTLDRSGKLHVISVADLDTRIKIIEDWFYSYNMLKQNGKNK